jgi:hypothetical protein
MAPNHLAGEMMKLEELADLIGISSRQQDLVAALLKLLNDGDKKRNVRGVVYIDPDLLLAFRGYAALKEPCGRF